MQTTHKLVECELINGDKRLVAANELVLRPAVYAVVLRASQVLLVNTKSTNKWFFPGGGVEAGEKLEAALVREVLEETGVVISKISFFHFRESFFYYEPHHRAYHCLNVFYTAQVQDGAHDVSTVKQDSTDEADSYAWVDIASLRSEDMQSFASEVLEKIRDSFPNSCEK